MEKSDFIITVSELMAIRDRVKLVDVREPEEWDEGHLEGATLIPLGEIGLRGPRELDPADEIVLYCAHGVRSVYALMALKQQGFEKLKSLEGGIVAWHEQGGGK